MAASAKIPLVDLAPYFAENATQEAKDQVVKEVCDAARTYGFFSIVGHGIPLKDQDTTLECAKKFFDLSAEEKKAVFIENCLGISNRGYEMYRGQTSEPGTLPDMKEGFVIGAEIPKDHPDAGTFLTGPNQWPESLKSEDFEKPLMEYRNKMVKLAEKVLRILALGLPKEWNCSPDVFDEFFIDPSGNLRLLHYPPQLSTDPKQLGAGAHTDFGGITFLLQQPGSKGLEVFYPPTESWVPVPVTPDSYVVNIGDLVQKWTAGYYRSALHRVINFGENHRYSAPFFLNGNMKLKIQPLNGSGQEFGVRDHFMWRLKTSLGEEKSKFLEKDRTVQAVAA
ncbi:hypothetical protein COCMIDRAFT_10034 [Bipolaris oryzae ATCC 44560]|uniref:Fe2OG dioxygenase domain-containing protein n=1 Tax=Bipolaris oryzae ATCC 44560 TaxID=930090 RepID=W6YLB7_COCMI|nr:uncharacterized protein COCMIDRAFT_10034 [Bipolaris oryzae ATCC 44560]EUC39997.1 hypothetical protein COCMIDRAFT_10034 [Bipolaris oryzae ATCC 44560]